MKTTSAKAGLNTVEWPAALTRILADRELFRRLILCLSLLSGVFITTIGLAAAVLLARGDVVAALLGECGK
ncbi:hypothetical protein [Amycolatopsis sp. GA6-003]|uniref:hypothetical protein n=1 Tax=Amycolatopsis sp. GA6-003 TaxID=2652444 RepID=UPI00391712D6